MKKSSRLVRILSVLVAVILPFLQVQNASAILDQCRGDPIFFLSDNTKLTVVVVMDTAESNVQKLTYVLHLPAGVNVQKAVYTAGGLGRKETFTVVQDNQPNKYTTDTYVRTKTSGVNIVVTASLSTTISGTAVGHNDEHLIIELQKP